jgi:hypothetical protein
LTTPTEPTQPLYWGDGEPIPLYRGVIEEHYSSGVLRLQGEVSLEWTPSPRITWSGYTSDTTSTMAALRRLLSISEEEPEIGFPDLTGLPPTRPRAKSDPASPPTYSTGGFLPPTEFSNGRAPHFIICNVINGPILSGPGAEVLAQGGSSWAGRLRLVGSTWDLQLDLRPDHNEIRQQLRSQGGFAFTHVAELRRSDGGPFSSGDEIDEVLEALGEFLSFCHGAPVGIALPVGLDWAARRCFVRWGAGRAAEWRNAVSWVDPVRPFDVVELFPRFEALRRDPFWGEVISNAIRYYLDANEPDPVNLAIATAQPAFELLAWSILKEQTQLIASKIFDQLTAREKIERLLLLAGIPPNLPASCSSLSSQAALHRWTSGPHAITHMRNTMIHPTLNKARFSVDCWIEAWRLTLSYLEFVLLRLMSYQGRHLGRLPGATRFAGGSEPLPWLW